MAKIFVLTGEESLFDEAHVFASSRNLSDILQIHGEGFTPLFDTTSLRNTVYL